RATRAGTSRATPRYSLGLSGLLRECLPEPAGNRAMRLAQLAGGDEFHGAATKVPVGDRDEPSLCKIVRHEVGRHVPPAQSLDDDLFFHHLVGHGALTRTFEHEVVARRGARRAVADDALDKLAHAFDRRRRDRERQETRGCDWNERHTPQAQALETRL